MVAMWHCRTKNKEVSPTGVNYHWVYLRIVIIQSYHYEFSINIGKTGQVD